MLKRLTFLGLAFLISLPVNTAQADGFTMGAGRWTCADIIRVYESGTDLEKGQAIGWILGYWSKATFHRETEFVDTVEAVGGRKIVDATFGECQKAPPDTLLFRLADSMITNTK